jgi:hypothetical protein
MHNTVDQRVLEFERSKMSIAYLGNGDFTIDRRALAPNEQHVGPIHVDWNIQSCLQWAKRDLASEKWERHDITWFYARATSLERDFGASFNGVGFDIDNPSIDHWPVWEAPKPISAADRKRAAEAKKEEANEAQKKKRAARKRNAEGPVVSVAEADVVASEKAEDGELLDDADIGPEPIVATENKLSMFDIVKRGCSAEVKMFNAYWDNAEPIRPESLVDSRGFTIVHLALMGHHATNELKMLSAVLKRLDGMSPGQAKTFVNMATRQHDPKGLVIISMTETTRFVAAGDVTPLQQAIMYNSQSAVSRLLKWGADMESRSKAVPPPKELAQLLKRDEIGRLFAENLETKRHLSAVYPNAPPSNTTTASAPAPSPALAPVSTATTAPPPQSVSKVPLTMTKGATKRR